MIIDLLRARTPEEISEDERCGICAKRFRPEPILASVATDGKELLGLACPECVAFLGRYKPQQFPTIEEFEAAVALFPAPIWASSLEASAAEERGGAAYQEALQASWIERSWLRD